MTNRFRIIIFINIILIVILFLYIFNIQIVNYKKYKKLYDEYSENIIYGDVSPRGRILDRYGRIIVDNKPVKTILYKKMGGNEVKIAYILAQYLDIDYSKINDDILKTFWIKINYDKSKSKITKAEYLNLKYRKINLKDIEQLKKDRITLDELNGLNELDKEAAYIYYLMNRGYAYSWKVIKNKDVSDSEYAVISSNMDKLVGVRTKIDWDRYYPYGDTFKSILGSVSSSEKGIPEELKNHYLKKGYNLNDRVGTSYLEYQYDDYLKGKKSKYILNIDNSLKLVEQGKKGNDIYLTIDIELQREVEKIIEEEIINAKSEPNTTFYNRSFVIITNPFTGEILAMAGKKIYYVDKDIRFYDYTPGIIIEPLTVGSVVKGASQIVGYNTNALKIGEIRDDACIKLKGAPSKCSWKYLGKIDDLKALKLSSNTYQFNTALKVSGVKYYYDMPFKIENDAFKIYRDTFKEFGLGTKTGIDLPNESSGLIGSKDTSGLLLDYVIGQYDNYTPLELSQYISTIASNGNRMKYHLLKKYYENDTLKEVEPVLLNKVNTDSIYLDRVKLGFRQVMEIGGTGAGYIDLKHNPSGKTGTSQSFVDSNNDGLVDTSTVSNTFVAYAPFDDPKVTFTVISPDTYDYKTNYQTYVNKRISKRISEKYFEIYE